MPSLKRSFIATRRGGRPSFTPTPRPEQLCPPAPPSTSQSEVTHRAIFDKYQLINSLLGIFDPLPSPDAPDARIEFPNPRPPVISLPAVRAIASESTAASVAEPGTEPRGSVAILLPLVMRLLRPQTAKVIHVVVPATYCCYAFFGQSVVKVRVEAWTLGRFSPVAAPYYEVAVSVLGERDMHESQRQVKAVVVVVVILLPRLSQRLGSACEPIDLALRNPAVVWVLYFARYLLVGV